MDRTAVRAVSFPIPVLRSDRIGNMPETGVKLKGIMSAHLDQFYFK